MTKRNPVHVRAVADVPCLSAGHRLQRVLTAYYRRSGCAADPHVEPQAYYWDACHHGLDKLSLFRSAPPWEQRRILAALSAGLLSEAYFIEKAGMAYCAKMVLLAETTEERQTYCLMAADEATHLRYIGAYLDRPAQRARPDAFADFLSGLIETGDRNSLSYLLQVILEGWGITYYRSLAAGCRDVELTQLLLRIVHDEGLHHASGVALFDPRRVTRAQRRFLLDALAEFLNMIRGGTVGLVATIDAIRGGLDRRDSLTALEELAAASAPIRRLERLRSLMAQPGMAWVPDTLDRAGLFTPCTPAQCAAALRR